MGYILYGYPSRRRRGQKTQDLKSIQFVLEKNSSHAEKKLKKHKSDDIHYESPNRVRNLNDLPVEILQKIFVLSLNLRSMPVVSKYLYHTLKPSSSLINQIFWEKYSMVPEDEELIAAKVPPGKMLVLDVIFKKRLFFENLMNNYIKLGEKIYGFVPEITYQKYSQKKDPIALSQWLDTTEMTDFPAIFFSRFDIYVSNREFVRYLRKYFILSEPYLVINSFINWFFRDQVMYTFDIIYSSIEFIISLSDIQPTQLLSPLPLITLLKNLNEGDNYAILITKLDNIDNPIFENFTEFTCVKMFIEHFHSEEESSKELSSPMLWKTLRYISDVRIIDLIIEHGGHPQYDVMV